MSQASLFVGIDLGNEHHALCIVNDVGKVVLERTVSNDLTAFEAVRRCMGDLDPTAVHVAVEDKNNALVDVLLAHGFRVSTINPKQVDRFRERGNVAGAKDDRRDARVLAMTLRSDGELYRLIDVGSPETVMTRSLSASVDHVTEELRRYSNHLRAQVLRCFPTLLGLCSGTDEPWFWDLIIELMPVGDVDEKVIAGILKRHRKRKLTAAAVLSVIRHNRLVPAPGVAEAATGEVRRLVEKLRLIERQRREIVTEREQVLETMKGSPEKPSDVDIVRSLPGFGPKTTAVFVGAALSLIKRDGGIAIVRAIAGVAPVTRQSGKTRIVQMRRACDPRLREALFHAAMAAVRHDTRFHDHYARLRAASHNHARALRTIGDRLLGVLDAMLRNRTTYRPMPTAAA